ETDLNLTMLPSAVIRGTVVDGAGKPISGARGGGQKIEPRAAPGAPQILAQFSSAEAVSEDDGTFLVEELAPDRYTLAASADGFRPCELWGIESGGPPITLRLGLGAAIHGEVAVAPDFLRAMPTPAAPARALSDVP